MVNRIRELLEARQLSPTQFADFIGVGRPVISHILSERNKPSLEVVQKVLDAFPDVSLTWLLKGIGPMLTDTTTASVAPATAPIPSPAAPMAATIAAVPLSAPPATLAPTSAPATSLAPHPQSFTTYKVGDTATGQPVAASVQAPRPLPPRFRPGPAKAAATSPQPAAGAALLPTEPTGTGATPLAQVPAAAPAPLLPATVVVAAGGPAAGLESHEAPERIAALPPTASALPTAPLAEGQAPELVASAADTPTAAGPVAANPAAALSFLGEPGKAIRRIVIFYRDGSFSDYVPEGQ